MYKKRLRTALTLRLSRFVIFTPGGKFITNLSFDAQVLQHVQCRTPFILLTRLKSFAEKL